MNFSASTSVFWVILASSHPHPFLLHPPVVIVHPAPLAPLLQLLEPQLLLRLGTLHTSKLIIQSKLIRSQLWRWRSVYFKFLRKYRNILFSCSDGSHSDSSAGIFYSTNHVFTDRLGPGPRVRLPVRLHTEIKLKFKLSTSQGSLKTA